MLTASQDDHPAHYIADVMAYTHDAMIRGLNSIYNQARHIPANKTDISDFLFFIEAWAAWILHHHDLEEKFMFPGFERVLGNPGALAVSSAQHEVFASGLEELHNYAKDSRSVDAYSGAYVCELIGRFADSFCEHLG